MSVLDPLGVCDHHGPCDPMRRNLQWGGVYVVKGQLFLAGLDARLHFCVWCGSRTLQPADTAAWPWHQLRPVKEDAT